MKFHDKSKYHHFFIPYSGPQCYQDLMINPYKLDYDVNYKSHPPKDVKYATPSKDETNELVETLDSGFSLKKCVSCGKL